MKVAFFSSDEELVAIAEQFVVGQSLCTDSKERLLEFLEESDESCLLFLDYDNLGERARSENENLLEDEYTIRLIIDSSLSVTEIIQHQSSSSGASGYLKRPFTFETIIKLLNDFELAENISENKNIEITFASMRLPDINEKTVEDDSLLSKFDESKEEGFEITDSDILGEDVKNADGNKILALYGIDLTQREKYSSTLNDEIQKKFDLVFAASGTTATTHEYEEAGIELPAFDECDDKNNNEDAEFTLSDIEMDSDDNSRSEMSFDSIEDNMNDKSNPDDKDDDVLEFSVSDNAIDDLIEEDGDGQDEIDFDLNLGTDEVIKEKDDIELSAEDDGVLECDFQIEGAGGEVESKLDGKELLDPTDPNFSIGESLEDTNLDLSACEEEIIVEKNEDNTLFDLGDEEIEIDSELEKIEDENLDVNIDDDKEDLLFSGAIENESDPSIIDEEDVESSSEDNTAATILFNKADLDETGEIQVDDILEKENIIDNTGATSATLLTSSNDADADATGDIDISAFAKKDDEFSEFSYSTSTEQKSEASINKTTTSTHREVEKAVDSTGSENLGTISLISDSEKIEKDDINATMTATLYENEVENALNETTTNLEGHQHFEVSENKTDLIKITPEKERVDPLYDEDNLLRQQATVRQLRLEREELLEKIKTFKNQNEILVQDNLGLKAELDDVKIEVTILKKRHLAELEEFKYQLRLKDERKEISEEKVKSYQKEFERLNHKVRIDLNQIKKREQELEGQLELAKMDGESQVQSRDMKILDLKRKIDSLEFNMENASIREQKYRDDKVKLEERLNKIMRTLRGSIEVIEEDIHLDTGEFLKSEKG